MSEKDLPQKSSAKRKPSEEEEDDHDTPVAGDKSTASSNGASDDVDLEVGSDEDCGCEEDCEHDHSDLHVHESDPHDPVTSICEQINKDLEAWQTDGTLTKDKLNEALDRFNAALRMTSAHMDALLGKAYVQGELGHSEAALETLLKAMTIDSKDIRVHTMLSELGEFADEGPDLEIVEKFMDERGNPTPKFKAALSEIFERFSVGTPKAITKQTMDKFHHFVNGGPLSQDAMDFLFSGEWELDKNGNITLEGFINFYLNQTFTDPQETISDLRKLGYNEDLEPIATPQSTAPTAAVN